MTWTFFSHTMRQKSPTVLASGPWQAMNSLAIEYPCQQVYLVINISYINLLNIYVYIKKQKHLWIKNWKESIKLIIQLPVGLFLWCLQGCMKVSSLPYPNASFVLFEPSLCTSMSFTHALLPYPSIFQVAFYCNIWFSGFRCTGSIGGMGQETEIRLWLELSTFVYGMGSSDENNQYSLLQVSLCIQSK